jgi:hypothetical protein
MIAAANKVDKITIAIITALLIPTVNNIRETLDIQIGVKSMNVIIKVVRRFFICHYLPRFEAPVTKLVPTTEDAEDHLSLPHPFYTRRVGVRNFCE